MPPLENSEYAFILHSLEMLSTYGTAAIIVPHGVLYRSLIEKDIRKYLIDEKNYLDAVIGIWRIRHNRIKTSVIDEFRVF
jgi:type I restriction enzyme M protein